jgi:Ca2+-binding EF-hand superfamily protein
MAYQDNDDQIAEIIHRIQVYVLPRRIRTREFFVNFDGLRSGRCTKVQFGRAVDTSGVRLSDAEVDLLADHFTQDGPNVQKPQVVNYVKFCEIIDSIFNDADLSFNSQEGLDTSQSSMMKASMTQFIPKEVNDMEKMNHIMHRLATLCKCRGIVLKYIYQDIERCINPTVALCNPRRSGKVTQGQFKRMFPFKEQFKDEEVQLMCDRYSTETGDVHFQAIHNDISEVLCPDPPPFPESSLVLKPDGTQWEHMRLNPVKKIQAKIVEKRLRMEEYFHDFDALRKGFCTAGQLKAVLTILNLEKEIDRNDFNHLAEAYSREDGMFCYALFCRDINAAFSVPGLEKDPMACTPIPDATTTAPGRRNRMVLSAEERRKVDELEDKIRNRISKRRIWLNPPFLDMDKGHKGFLSRSQFGRCMGQLGFELDQSDIALLAAVYCDRGNHNDFNYMDFIKANDVPDEEQEIALAQLSSPYQEQSPSKYFDGMRIHPCDRAMSPLLT